MFLAADAIDVRTHLDNDTTEHRAEQMSDLGSLEHEEDLDFLVHLHRLYPGSSGSPYQ